MGKKLVQGVGVSEKGKHPISIGRKRTKEYILWQNMLERCYSAKLHARYPNYIGCETSDNFKNFQYFAEWCNNQIGWCEDDWQLDKDLFSVGNKIYSEDTCFFVPRKINVFLNRRRNSRGDYPQGVALYRPLMKYTSQICNGTRKTTYLGRFDTPEEAFYVYKEYKENLAKALAIEYSGRIHSKVIESLNNFTVEITD
jgi:hypothetical protein